MDKIGEAATTGAAVDMSMTMNTFANDIVSRAMSGKFFRAEGRNKLFRELVEANSALFGGFNLEYFPGQARSLGFLSRRFLHNRVHETHNRWEATTIEETLCIAMTEVTSLMCCSWSRKSMV
jgi:hypothetical protein